MNPDKVLLLFMDIKDSLSALQAVLLEAIKNEVDTGSISIKNGDTEVRIQWPYPYGDEKLDLKLEVTAGIKREEP